MSITAKLFGKKESELSEREQEAVLVYLDGLNLPDEVYRTCDLSTIEDRLVDVLDSQSLGEFDGNEFHPTETVLFMYGADAERLFKGIEPTLRDYPLCRNARVVIRRGGPGALERELRIL
jgi:hypothetical protein